MLDTVNDFIAQSRLILQDTVAPYRYGDTDLIQALNIACQQAGGWRFDLFMGAVPQFSAGGDATSTIPEIYRPSFLRFVIGWAELRDAEATEEARASSFLVAFRGELMGMGSVR